MTTTKHPNRRMKATLATILTIAVLTGSNLASANNQWGESVLVPHWCNECTEVKALLICSTMFTLAIAENPGLSTALRDWSLAFSELASRILSTQGKSRGQISSIFNDVPYYAQEAASIALRYPHLKKQFPDDCVNFSTDVAEKHSKN